MRHLLLPVIAMVLLAAATASALTWHVPSAECPTIQAGVDSASADGDTVLVAPGTYFENVKIIGKSVWLCGSGADVTIIDGSTPSNPDSASVVLFSTDGIPGGISGGIKDFTLQRGTGTKGVMNPEGWYGGGIVCTDPAGSGDACADGSHPTIEDNVIVDNHVADPSQVSQGGGLKCYYSSPTVRGNVFTGNSADHAGGAISIRHSCAEIEENWLEDNSCIVSAGGGIAVEHSSDCIIDGNVLVGNSSGNQAGGIDVYLALPVITNNTFVGNSAASDQAGGINCRNSADAEISNNIISLSPTGKGVECEGASPTFACNDIWGNAEGDGICGIDGGGNFSEDPLFCMDENPTDPYTLRNDSPCVPGNHPDGYDCGLIGALGIGCQVALPAVVDIDPDVLNPRSGGRWITAYIELPEDYDPEEIDVSTVLLNDTVPADLHPTDVGDYDGDDVPDRMVKFSRPAVIDILPSGERVEVRVSGDVGDYVFVGADTIRVLMPKVTYPNGGESLEAGNECVVTWETPSGYVPDTYSIYYTMDGGETWEVIAESIVGHSYRWIVPDAASVNCLVLVEAYDEEGIMGYDESDYAFTLRSGSGSPGEEEPPSCFALYGCSPNPFAAMTVIAFDIPESAAARVTIYDTHGRIIRRLTNNKYEPGRHEIIWQGVDDAGNSVSSGIYFIRMDAGAFKEVRKVMLLR